MSPRASLEARPYLQASVMHAGSFSAGVFSSMLMPSVLLGIYCLVGVVAAEENECLVDAKIGFSDPANVYQCKPPLKCCFEYSKPSCCGNKPSWQIIQEQVTLWGGLFAILLTIASIVYCRKNDLTLPACAPLKEGLTRCCCGSSDDEDAQQGMALKVGSTPSGKASAEEKGTHHGWRNNTVNPITEYTHIEMSRV